MTSDAPRPARQEQERAADDITEVASGVLRLQLPIDLPGLGHVNCYALEDGDGFALVDPGLPGSESWRQLLRRLDRADIPLDRVHTVIVTHSHTDHFGGAMRLRDEVNARVVTHESFRLFWDTAELLDDEDSASLELTDDDAIAAFRDRHPSSTPWGTANDGPPIEIIRLLFEERRRGEIHPTLRPDLGLVDGQPVHLARREWFAVHTPGHTHDHLCLYDPTEGVMLSGDHVLPTITPHIGGFRADTDSLDEFISSLHRVAGFDDVRMVLPAHGHPFTDLAGRSEEIVEHHQGRLDKIRDAVDELGTADVVTHMQLLFKERSWGRMAESETFAHLVHLEALGEIERVNRSGPATFAPTAR